ncbi:hypothetical protein FRC03_003099 [Tulasnella sp. 419]|nr:hypothetical protein FRC02_004035 [Tulasnella sp. 418]KAG8969408.1 hypothetical protein FRC03_003099 [Tulasnella sp. 419]
MDTSSETNNADTSAPPLDDFVSSLLTPGSTRHKFWIAALDAAFAFLLIVFLWQLYLTWGTSNRKHVLALIGIEGCLWASIKWFVYELEKLPPPPAVEQEKKEQ